MELRTLTICWIGKDCIKTNNYLKPKTTTIIATTETCIVELNPKNEILKILTTKWRKFS